MTNAARVFFGFYFIAWGLVILFLLPAEAPAKLMNYIIIGTYFLAMLWWGYWGYPWWVGYWLSAMAITAVVTFGNFNAKV